MNRASRYSASVTFLAFARVVIVAFCVCMCHWAQLSDGKVFERCELAQILRYGHGLDVNDVANWVCIAQHSSSLNTSAFGGNARSGSHGLFQISDQYWCSPPGKGVACGVTCDRLRDDDITDDLACVQVIYQEHQRLSGDGYNAWIAYQSYCRDNPYEYIEDCFGNEEREYLHSKSVAANVVDDDEEDDSVVYSRKRGKVYGRCELAKELFLKHKMPMEEIPTWVCIAQHESNYDTSAVGRLNADGSADHGLFQISDLYWCHHKGGRRKACGMPCSKLLDADITDDVKCVKQIYKEHTRISGNGFTAWTVYNAYCTGKTAAYVRGCFDGIDVEQPKISEEYRKVSTPPKVKSQKPHGKVYEPCELAEELRTKHHMPEDQIATWVCIAKHESDYNTSAIGYGDHGLFQISDIYWCSPPGKGWACGLSCADLEDSDITDDVECIRKIYREHTQLSGDGFKAWTVYPRFCSQGRSAKYIAHCPGQHSQPKIAAQSQSNTRIASPNAIAEYEPKRGKVYGRCELAKELLEKHDMGMDEIPTWVCIAHHESNFDTSAVGRLNADGSADHGLFQISDLYWCSHKEGHRKACGLPCSKLLDNDISDDVRCVKQIHEEHTRISGDGFTAWTVYTPYCKQRTEQYIRGCFDGTAAADDFSPPQRALSPGYVSKKKPKGKVFEECELAKELQDKHRVPKEQIATWVCIAQHQSGLNTSSAVSNVHGLFHISDEFWCSPPGKGTACELHCDDLEDSDITDDVECIKKIYQEHQRLFGDGFNAWVTYPQHCSQGRADSYISHCPGFKSTAANAISYGSQQGVIKTHPKLGGRVIQVTNLPVYSHAFQANPFLKHFEVVNSNVIAPTLTQPAVDKPTYDHGFNANPFLKHFNTVSGNTITPSSTQSPADKPTFNHEFNVNPFLRHYDTKSKAASSGFYSTSEQLSASASEEVIDSVPVSRELSLSSLTKQPTLNPFTFNPFLKTISTGFVKPSTTATPFSGFSIKPTPTKSKTFGPNSYQPQNEEKAKFEAFKSLALPYLSSSTQPPRANRLQTYNLNTAKSTTTPTTTSTTSAPATTRLPWYQLNTLSSAKPIVQTKSTSGKLKPSFVTSKPFSVTSKPFSVTSKPQLIGGSNFNRAVIPTTSTPFTVFSFSTVKPPVGAIHTSTSRPSSISTPAPKTITGFSFSRVGFPSTQTTTLRPVFGSSFGTATSKGVSGVSVTSSNTGVTTLRPFTAFLANTAKPTSVGGSSLNRIPSTTRPYSATTRAPQKAPKEDTGHYDPGRYDAGRYDAGRYDAGRYDAGKYNPKPNSQPTSSPVARTAFSSFGFSSPTPTLHSRDQTTSRIGITTLRPSSSFIAFSHPTVQPQESRFLSRYISSEQEDSFKPSVFTSSLLDPSSLGAFSIPNLIPGVKITNLGNVGVSIHKPGLATPSVSSTNLDLFPSASSSVPVQVDHPVVSSQADQPVSSSVSVESSDLSLTPSFASTHDADTVEPLKSSEKPQDSAETKTEFIDSTKSEISSVSSSSTSEEGPSSATEVQKPSSIIPTSVDASQIPSSSNTPSNVALPSPSIEPAVLADATSEPDIGLQSSKTESVKQPSSTSLKPIPKTSSAFTAGSAESSVALKPTSTAQIQTVATQPSLRLVETLTPTRSLPLDTAESSIPASLSSTSESKPLTSTISRSTSTTATKSTIQPTPPSKSKPLPVVTSKSASAMTQPSSSRQSMITSSPSTAAASKAPSKPSFGAITTTGSPTIAASKPTFGAIMTTRSPTISQSSNSRSVPTSNAALKPTNAAITTTRSTTVAASKPSFGAIMTTGTPTVSKSSSWTKSAITTNSKSSQTTNDVSKPSFGTITTTRSPTISVSKSSFGATTTTRSITASESSSSRSAQASNAATKPNFGAKITTRSPTASQSSSSRSVPASIAESKPSFGFKTTTRSSTTTQTSRRSKPATTSSSSSAPSQPSFGAITTTRSSTTTNIWSWTKSAITTSSKSDDGTQASKTALKPSFGTVTTTRSPTFSQSSSWTRSVAASSTTSKPSFSAIKSAPTSPARPVPTPTLKKSDITFVKGPSKPTAFGGPRLPTPTSTKSSQSSSSQGSVKPTPSRPTPTPTRSQFGTSKPTRKPSFTSSTKKPSVTQTSRTANSTRSSRSTRSIIASSSSTGIAHSNSIIITKPIISAKSSTTGLPAAISQTSSAKLSPTLSATHRASSRPAVQISPTKPHRPTGSLFSTKLNIYEFYSKLYGSYPPTKTSSPQPATKTRQVNVVVPSHTS